MTHPLTLSRPLFQRLLLMGLLLAGLSLCTQLFPISQALAVGFSADFLLTLPLVYWLLIRKTTVPVITVVPFSLAMLLLAGWLIPAEHQAVLALYQQWMLPLLELAVVSAVFVKMRRAHRVYTAAAQQQQDGFQRLQQALKEIVGVERVAAIVATEFAMFYYAFRAFGQKGNRKGYSYHSQTALPAVLGALMLLVVVETFAVHVLVMQWSVLLANILSLVSLYSLLFLLALIGAARHRPHQLGNQELLIRFGLQEARIPYTHIAEAVCVRGEVQKKEGLVQLGMLGNYNCIITSNKPMVLSGLYGLHHPFTAIAFWVDELDPFLAELAHKIEPDATAAPHTAGSTRP
jgi:hypothetical protein